MASTSLNVGIRNASNHVDTPFATPQVITAVGNAITLRDSVIVKIQANASYTLTSTPTIPDGLDGQHLYIVNVDDADTITLQDEGTLSGSNIELKTGNTLAMAPKTMHHFVFIGVLSAWQEV